MGTITHLAGRRSRTCGEPGEDAVVVTAHGFALGTRTLAWQAVHEVWAYRIDLATDGEAFLEFVAGGDRIAVGERRAGFQALEARLMAVFPSTLEWRQAACRPALGRNRTLLYRRY